MRRLIAGLVVAAASVGACSGSDGSDDVDDVDDVEAPTLDRIDGPAQVDPSYDPFATASSTPATPGAED